jgi:hypothetical protein
MIVELMLGVKVTSASAGAGSPMIVCGAGNSSVPSMKHAGKAHGSPLAPPRGKGGTRMNAAMLPTITSPMIRNHLDETPRPPRLGGALALSGAASGAGTCSLDTLAPHTGARLDAALTSSQAGRDGTGYSTDRRNRSINL